MSAVKMGSVGIWSTELRYGDPAVADEVAAELEALGYGALWIPGGIDDGVLSDVERLLKRTSRIAIGTGIINIWKQPAEEVAAWWRAQSPAHQARVMLGLGVSHGPIIGEQWSKPLALMASYVDTLMAEGVPASSVCVAALGPKMLKLAGEMTAGAHPYLITPDHSAIAREAMGPGKLVAPEQGVVVETDPARARAMARDALDHYRFLPNYKNSWKRLGFTDQEIDGLADRLIDELFAWGTPTQIAQRVREHHAAGADHVCLQVIAGGHFDKCRADFRALAEVLL